MKRAPSLRIFWTLGLSLLLFAGCGDDKESGDTGDVPETGDPGDTQDTEDTEDPNDDENAPVIESASATCAEHQTGDTYWKWTLEAQADDPQGVDTIVSYDPDNSVCVVTDAGGTEYTTQALACADGTCTGSFKQDDYMVLCTNAGNYTFTFTVVDEDGNVSEPYAVQGAQGK